MCVAVIGQFFYGAALYLQTVLHSVVQAYCLSVGNSALLLLSNHWQGVCKPADNGTKQETDDFLFL